MLETPTASRSAPMLRPIPDSLSTAQPVGVGEKGGRGEGAIEPNVQAD